MECRGEGPRKGWGGGERGEDQSAELLVHHLWPESPSYMFLLSGCLLSTHQSTPSSHPLILPLVPPPTPIPVSFSFLSHQSWARVRDLGPNVLGPVHPVILDVIRPLRQISGLDEVIERSGGQSSPHTPSYNNHYHNQTNPKPPSTLFMIKGLLPHVGHGGGDGCRAFGAVQQEAQPGGDFWGCLPRVVGRDAAGGRQRAFYVRRAERERHVASLSRHDQGVGVDMLGELLPFPSSLPSSSSSLCFVL
jgi:hypothetical protein